MNRTAFLLVLAALLMVTSLISCGPAPPTVTTNDATDITADSATLAGSLDILGGYATVDVSFVWGPNSETNPADYPNETTPQPKTSNGDFTAALSGLLPSTTYYFSAKGTGSVTVYGDEFSFTTKTPPVVTTNDATNISASGAGLNGNLADLGSASSVSASFVWGTTSGGPYPNETAPQTTNASGAFTFNLTGLTSGMTYYFQSKALGDGTDYGSEKSLTTPAPVTFPDSNLEALIRESINKPEGTIYTSDLYSLTELDAQFGNGISDLTGLEHCTNLTVLLLKDNQISDISPIASLTNLTSLLLSDGQISDISAVANLTNLRELILRSNQISDISPVANLTNLMVLLINDNQISDISPIASLTNLMWVWLHQNQISDISPLANLTNLDHLWLGWNQISDISPLASLPKLIELVLESNQISDISPLVENSGLGQGDIVDLRSNPLSTTSVNEYIPQLEERGVNVEH